MSSPALYHRSLVFEVMGPAGEGAASAQLAELQAFRGRELYADGRRPAFRVGEDRYRDADERDGHAYHLALRSAETGDLVGCFRLMPLDRSPVSQVEAALGREGAERALLAIGAERRDMMEAARWIVRRDQQGRGVGSAVMAGAFALCQLLGYQAFWSIAGMRDGQAQLAMRAGYRPIPGTSVISSEQFADELCPIYAFASSPSSRIAPLVAQLRIVLAPLVLALGIAPEQSEAA